MEALLMHVGYEPYLKLVLALVLGMALGVERSISGKKAGMRTFALVSLGASLFIVVSETLVLDSFPNTAVDPTRIAAAIITGIGFLGAGVIIFQRELKGLTTAAGLWTAAGIGVAVGHGLYSLAIFGTFLALFVFTVMWHIEQFLEKKLGGKNSGHTHDHDHNGD